jgi:hypothetical protein
LVPSWDPINSGGEQVIVAVAGDVCDNFSDSIEQRLFDAPYHLKIERKVWAYFYDRKEKCIYVVDWCNSKSTSIINIMTNTSYEISSEMRVGAESDLSSYSIPSEEDIRLLAEIHNSRI